MYNRDKRVRMNIILLFVICLQRLGAALPELQLVNVIFRHGDRTPDSKSMFPTDPNYTSDFYPIGYGGLTNAGKLRSFELGEFLRNRYDEFLGDVYFPDLLYARSTHVDRAKMSLQLVLAGLFPPSAEQKWHKSLDWQPIPSTYFSAKQDDVLAASLPIFNSERQRVRTTRDMKRRIDSFAEFMSQLTNLTGKQMTTPTDVKGVYNTLFFEQNMNLTLPDWTEGLFPDGKLLEITLFDFETLTYDTNITRLLNGKLISKLTNDMLAVKNKKGLGERNTRLFLYSTHDTHVNGLLRSLNVHRTHIPYFSSAAIIELLKEENEYYVKILYYQGNTTTIEELKMPGCSELCPIDKYLANVHHLLS